MMFNSELCLLVRVTLYAEFLPMRSRATCILLIEVRTTTHDHLSTSVICPAAPLSVISCMQSKCIIQFFRKCIAVSAQIFWALGTVFEVLLAIVVMPTLGWRWLLALSTIPLFIFAILCFVSMTLSAVMCSFKTMELVIRRTAISNN